MKKQNGSFFGRLVKRIFLLLVLALLVAGGYFAWEHRDDVNEYIDFGPVKNSILTFELTYPPELIMQQHQKELLRTREHSFSKSYVIFSPLLLMQVKFSHDAKTTQEADCLWDLRVAEMVLQTNTFETTHGFEDCINSGATEDDFRILQALARYDGTLSKQALAQELGCDNEVVIGKLESLRRKHLIVQKLDSVTLHFQTPLLKVVPKTTLTQPLVWKVVPKDGQTSGRYSKDQIQKLTKAAFGQDFAIRSIQEIYMPISVIEVQNPDGSELKTYWNGVTGKKIVWQP